MVPHSKSSNAQAAKVCFQQVEVGDVSGLPGCSVDDQHLKHWQGPDPKISRGFGREHGEHHQDSGHGHAERQSEACYHETPASEIHGPNKQTYSGLVGIVPTRTAV